jgi:hypothetical protein
VALAEIAGIASLSDTALFNRLRKATIWLAWLALGLLEYLQMEVYKPGWLRGFQVKCFDASVIGKPGARGTDWRIHFSYDLFTLSFDQFKVTDHEVGESLCNYAVQPGDLVLADRGYAHLRGLHYVTQHGGDFLVRLPYRASQFHDVQDGHKINLLGELEQLGIGETREWLVVGKNCEGEVVPLRVCAVRLPRPKARKAQREAVRTSKRRGRSISSDALRFQRYVVVATSVSGDRLSAEQVLTLYRMRWQIEIAIKRLKSLVGIGELPCRGKESGRAWLHGKLVLALLIQVCVNRGQELPCFGNEAQEVEAGKRRRQGNLWRETDIILALLEFTILTGVSAARYLERLKRTRRKLEERKRRRRFQHELLVA